jgi:GNAT superfamily N-acetyltransferase
LIAHLTEIVNRIYLEAEGSFWKPGFKRTNAAEIKACLSSGNLALAWLGEASYHNHANLKTDLVGCANIKMSPEEETGEFGMLACDTAARGRGVGRELLRFAEDETLRRGARRMLLTLLQGDGWRHEFKARLEAWYGRNGYQLVRVEDVRTNWAFLAPLLAKPMVMKVFIKDL